MTISLKSRLSGHVFGFDVFENVQLGFNAVSYSGFDESMESCLSFFLIGLI
jgi:hypothetical protein